MGKPREINAKLSRIVSWERYLVDNLDTTHTHRKMEHEAQNGGTTGEVRPYPPLGAPSRTGTTPSIVRLVYGQISQ